MTENMENQIEFIGNKLESGDFYWEDNDLISLNGTNVFMKVYANDKDLMMKYDNRQYQNWCKCCEHKMNGGLLKGKCGGLVE